MVSFAKKYRKRVYFGWRAFRVGIGVYFWMLTDWHYLLKMISKWQVDLIVSILGEIQAERKICDSTICVCMLQ